jgi:general secretion pathway protein G
MSGPDSNFLMNSPFNIPSHPSNMTSVAHLLPRAVRRRSAFTLIELVLVLTILAVLMGAAIFSLNRGGFFEGAADQRIKSDLESTVSTALENYFIGAGRYPTTEQGLQALVEKPASAPIPERWHAVMDEIPTDPWKQPYKYRYPAIKSKKSYDLWSVGKDGVDGNEDDIGNWKSEAK